MQQRNRLATLIASACLCATLPLAAMADYAGPSNAPANPKVSDILAKPVDDQPVKLQGKLIKKIGDERYQFNDGSGTIEAEIDDDDMPRATVDENTLVEIVGEVDTSRYDPPEIDVDRVRIVNE
ncbi:NirD/YgiW/YdeI family stress tolerance protein [Allopusillimonas soli]|uniref:NirD/YgiW/YdeI family stress tolerance protein n=1 Tax=Allopusillimonas soli TaxID=659016 RepID=A0A853FHL5_9BURK|nr:NirD/YgiW/YdeI family stress tolerance protein [Allopusillimonas soli]NYT37476.1 NirD/YgiW/YdeI family stress tolerance protein [Allopusillimonas soli]TEA74544.1 NirD/YgiW/YdeI family stress tolerance protein [Allopusillimonas soli]